MELDETHLAMLDILRRDARSSVSSIAERVGVSRATAYARLGALEDAGVVRGYHAEIDPAAVGKSIAALVFVSIQQSQWADFRGRAHSLPELEYLAITTGQFDAMLLVRAENVAGIHALVVDDLAQWPSVKATETVFLMDEERHGFSVRATTRRPRSETGDYGATRFVGAPPARKRSRR